MKKDKRETNEQLDGLSVEELRQRLVQRGKENPHPIKQDGGSLDNAAFCRRLIDCESTDQLEEMRRAGELVYWQRGDVVMYPTYQIENGKVLNGIQEVIETMRSVHIVHPLDQSYRMVSPLTDRNGGCATVIELLQQGKIAEAKDLIVAQHQR